jgi:beta-galactosidase
MDRVEWFGLGPGPAYPDNGQAARPGWFSASVEGLLERTVRPQESGSRGDVRAARIGDAVGVALGITAEPAIGLTVRPWSTEMLAATTHDHLLVVDGRTHVVLDLARSGVGTAACGPGPLPPYRLTARRVQGSLLFSVTTATPTTEEHR